MPKVSYQSVNGTADRLSVKSFAARKQDKSKQANLQWRPNFFSSTLLNRALNTGEKSSVGAARILFPNSYAATRTHVSKQSCTKLAGPFEECSSTELPRRGWRPNLMLTLLFDDMAHQLRKQRSNVAKGKIGKLFFNKKTSSLSLCTSSTEIQTQDGSHWT